MLSGIFRQRAEFFYEMAEESLRDLATVVFSAQARRLQAHYLFDLNFDYISPPHPQNRI